MTEPQQAPVEEGAPKRVSLDADGRRALLQSLDGLNLNQDDGQHTDIALTFEGDDDVVAMNGRLVITRTEGDTVTRARWALGYLDGDTGPET